MSAYERKKESSVDSAEELCEEPNCKRKKKKDDSTTTYNSDDSNGSDDSAINGNSFLYI